MATHSSILAWKIPQMEEPSRPQSQGSQRVEHDLGAEEQQHYNATIITNECLIHLWVDFPP